MFEYQFRLIVIGDSTVGKSSLLRYFCDGKFCEESDPTVGVDFYARIVEIKPGVRIKLQIWDTAGQERFRSITRSYYRNSVGALLLYDITSYESFEHVNDWFNESRKQIEPLDACFMLVGCKSDKEHIREVPLTDAQQFADYHNLLFIETSSKTGHNVEKAFSLIGNEIYKKLEEGKFRIQEGWDGIKSGYIRTNIQQQQPKEPQLSLTEQNKKDNEAKKGCCS